MGKCHENLVHDIGISKVHLNLRPSIKINILLSGDLTSIALATPRIHFPTRILDDKCNPESDAGHESCYQHGINKLGSN